MPVVDFTALPQGSRVWVFASDRPLVGEDATRLLANVDEFLAQWKAHGVPLRNAREWRDDHFLVIGVDPTAEQASGCSIDGLFRGLQQLERALNTSLVAGGRIFYRDERGAVAKATRKDVRDLVGRGALRDSTPVFDTSVTDVGAYRARFEQPMQRSWVAALAGQASQPSSRSATNASSDRNG